MKNLNSYPQLYAEAFKNLNFDKEPLRNFAKQCPEGKILEIGGGSGRTIGYFEDRIHVLLESDQEMLAILKMRSQSFNNIEVIDGTCPLIPSSDKSFAGVFAAFGTMGEINPICITLNEIKRVLKDDGLVSLTIMNPEYYKTPPLGLNRNKTLNLDKFTFITNTIAVKSLGEGEFQTHIWARNQTQSSSFVVKQYFPSLEKWFVMIKELGFEIVNGVDHTSKDQVINLILKKAAIKSENLPSENLIAEIYDTIAPNYSNFIKSTQYGLYSWINNHLSKLSGLNPCVLDLACGNGLVGELINNHSIKPYRLYGYDISENMVRECMKSNFYHSAAKFDLSKGLPGVSGLNVDLITSFGLMEFVSDITLILKDIRRVLVLGGELWCSFEANDDDSDLSTATMNFKNNTVMRYKRSESKIRQLLIEAGFGDINIERNIGYISPSTGQKVDYFYVCAKRLEI